MAGRCVNCGRELTAQEEAFGVQRCDSCTATRPRGSALPPLPPAAPPPSGVSMRWIFAGFWQRLIAYIIDAVILTVIILILGAILSPIVWLVTYLAVAIGYPVIGNGLGGTIGKRVIGLRVVQASGEIPGIPRGLIRLLVAIPSGLALYLGYLWMLWDDDNQTWHDKAAGTYVVEA
jgi:uncharacterized RDD family membrane protein YckC